MAGRSYTGNVIVPMQPSNLGEPFSAPTWLFEPKWDGYRAICYYDKSCIRFIARRNNGLTKWFPELRTLDLRADAAIIDGEIVAIDDDGVPTFDELRKSCRSCAVVFNAFDLLTLNGEAIRNLPLLKGKSLLKRIVRRTKNTELDSQIILLATAWRYSPNLSGNNSKEW